MGLLSSILDGAVNNAETALGTLTWTGDTDPSSTTVKTYRFAVSGKKVSFWAKATYATAGVNNTLVTFALPALVPSPSTWGTQEASSLVTPGTGGLQTATTAAPAAGSVGLYEDGAGGWVIKVAAGAQATKAVSVYLNWIKA